MKIWLICALALAVVATIAAKASPEPRRAGYGGYGRRHGGVSKVVKVVKDVGHNNGYGHGYGSVGHSGYGRNSYGYNSIGNSYGRRNVGGYGGYGRRHKRSADPSPNPEPHRRGYGGYGKKRVRYGKGYGGQTVVKKVVVKDHGYNKYGHKGYNAGPKVVKKVVKVVKDHGLSHGNYGHNGYNQGNIGHQLYGQGIHRTGSYGNGYGYRHKRSADPEPSRLGGYGGYRHGGYRPRYPSYGSSFGAHDFSGYNPYNPSGSYIGSVGYQRY